MTTISVPLHDGNLIKAEIYGQGPAILMPVNPVPAGGAKADELRKWGVDPALGKTLIDGLCDRYQVIAFDYEGHVLQYPKADTLTPDNIAHDFAAIADAAGAERFAYYGYSWLALSGLQLALRTHRLTALIMGGFPPLEGPYRQMLLVTQATHNMAVSNQEHDSATAAQPFEDDPRDFGNSESSRNSGDPRDFGDAGDYDWSNVQVAMNEGQTKQFVTLYEQLQHFNDRKAQQTLTCPRLCFAGSKDRIEYGGPWHNAVVDIAGPIYKHRHELAQAGWECRLLPELDHTGAMQPQHVLPVISPWLDAVLQPD